jgi:hypothetical protein
LQKLGQDNLSFHQHLSQQNNWHGAGEKGLIKSKSTDAGEEEKTSIQKVITIADPFLCKYLSERRIPMDIARSFCQEIQFRIRDKNYCAIGFKNDAGGYELRSRFFKISTSPKAVSFIDKNTTEVKVFEGFFSFLSYRQLSKTSNTTDKFSGTQFTFFF